MTTTVRLPVVPMRLASVVSGAVYRRARVQPSDISSSADIDELLHRVAIGDRQAFGAFYDELSGAVYGTALRVIRDRAIAEEVAQDAFVEMWQKASDWNPARGKAKTWALMIAHRRAVDRVRREEAMRRRHEKTTLWSVPHRDNTADEVVDDDERRRVRRGLDALTDLQREAIELAYFQAMTYREVAERLDVPLGTIKTRMRDGLVRLREVMGGESL